jgi:hypothetical protein
MKLTHNDWTVTKRDLLCKLQKVKRALGAQAQRANAAERENSALIGEIIALRARAPA